MNRNLSCLSHWYPILQTTGVLTPRTEIIRTKINLRSLLDGKLPDGFTAFIERLVQSALRLGDPRVFLRTGQTSGKHEWKDTCYIDDPTTETMAKHVVALCEFSEMVDIMGLPYDVWVVREFLDLESTFTAFNGMPIAREVRLFIVDGKLQCVHPYFPPDAIDYPSEPDWRERLHRLSFLDDSDGEKLDEIAAAIGAKFTGGWSVDCCNTTDGLWYVTDMAEAARSFHWPDCPHAGREYT